MLHCSNTSPNKLTPPVTMKKAIMKLADLTGRLLACVWPARLSQQLGSLRDCIYTGYLRRRFAHFGNSVIAWKALKLIGLQFITVGDDTNIECGVQLSARTAGYATPRIVIGNGCQLRAGCHVTAVCSITIGDYLLTGTNVLITDNAHGDTLPDTLQLPPKERPLVSKGPVTIGNRVWMGNNVCIMPGVTIGDGAVIGAGSIVTHDVPAGSVVVGQPAHIIHQQTH